MFPVVERNVPRQKSLFAAVDWSTLFDAVAQLIESETRDWPADQKPVFSEDYPRQRTGQGFDHSYDVILWGIHSSHRASTSNTIERRPHGLRLLDSRPSPTKDGYLEEVYGWWEEVVVEFLLHSKSNAAANKLVNWFHRMMIRAGHRDHYFSSRGVTYFAFEERIPDVKTQQYGDDLYQRGLRYMFRLNLQDVYERRVLESVAVTGPCGEFEIR